ncbi:phage filamentation protein Fil family protein [Yersinia aleksiciae]|uniref:phage filamentation protein Fil family protein n=1 Tax=Yersinia aleksiciae TaxID=263819 RepID=UPI0011A71D7C|nr:phage filamentation protein Fil family protein [Yersinia aleksiciae]
MIISIAPLLKQQSPVNLRHFGHGMLELKNGQRWKLGSNQKALLQELSTTKKTPRLHRLFGY